MVLNSAEEPLQLKKVLQRNKELQDRITEALGTIIRVAHMVVEMPKEVREILTLPLYLLET